MQLLYSKRAHFLSLVSLVVLAGSSRADEGMWLLNDLPKELLNKQHNFVPTDDWARHVMLSSVRFSSGGSASFVSSNGLVLTNHHVAADTLQKLSTPENNYYEHGFLARTLEEELKAPDLELNQLVSIEDVTDQINAVVNDDMDANEAYKARQAAMATLEKKSLDETGLRSDVITLYGGAKYHLYRFKKYTDVRLVWSPEGNAAFFGGDADNFEYPRYCLDATLVRVYEDGKPAKIEHFLKWSDAGAGDGELVFVSGNPGSTQRITTAAAIKNLRDIYMPYLAELLLPHGDRAAAVLQREPRASAAGDRGSVRRAKLAQSHHRHAAGAANAGLYCSERSKPSRRCGASWRPTPSCNTTTMPGGRSSTWKKRKPRSTP